MNKKKKLILLGCGLFALLGLIIFILTIGFAIVFSNTDFIKYIRSIRPEMTKKEIKKIFPKESLLSERKVEYLPKLDRRFSDSQIVSQLFFLDNAGFGDESVTVFFDKDDIIVGIDYFLPDAPLGGRLEEADLRFPKKE